MLKQFSIVLILLVAGCVNVNGSNYKSNFDTDVLELYSSPMSLQETELLEVVNDRERFNEIWLSKLGDLGTVPTIDFSKYSIIAIFIGQKSSSGYSVYLDRVEQNIGTTKIKFVTSQPSPDCVVAQIITSPVTLVRVDKIDGGFEFEERTEIISCR